MLPEPRHRSRTPVARGRRALAGAAVLILGIAGVLAGILLPRGDGAPTADAATPSGVAALGPLTGPPTLVGRVVQVVDPGTVVVEVAGRPVTVSVVGVDVTGTPQCARPGALAFARDFLDGQEVTLVPDPTLPPPPADSPTWPAHLVVASQQSYTDAALVAGWVSAGEGRYRAGFETGERLAQDAMAGMWGPPCDRPVPGR